MARHRDFHKIDITEEQTLYDGHVGSYEDYYIGPMSPTTESYMAHNLNSSNLCDALFTNRIVEEDDQNDDQCHSPADGFFPDEKVTDWSMSEKSHNTSALSNGIATPNTSVPGAAWDASAPLPQRQPRKPQSPLLITAAGPEHGLSPPSAKQTGARGPSGDRTRQGSGSANKAQQQLSPEPEALSKLRISSANNSRSASPDPALSKAARSRLLARPEDSKQPLNLVIAGHVDAGKSTLMGHLLFLLGNVNQRTMHKYKQESQKMGKASFAYAWVLDETEEERKRGVTMDVAQVRFSTGKTDVILLDAPGHKDFIPNMITGAAQADAALLVVNATTGEFETGFDEGGQTREHAMLIRSLGVSQLTVVVNKLDTVDWSKSRYDHIQTKLGLYLKQAGFSKVAFVPACGMTGENLKEPCPPDSPLGKWYHGPTVVDAIDAFDAVKRSVEKPLRFSVSDVFKSPTSGGTLITGKVQTGSVQPGDRVVIAPNMEHAQVKGIQQEESTDVKPAFAGDQCTLVFAGALSTNVGKGHVICHPESALRPVTKFQATIAVFNVVVPITKGIPIVLHYQSSSEPAVISKLVSQIDRKTGELKKAKPRCLVRHTSGVVEITTERPVCVERNEDTKELGRVTLRASGHTIAAGIVTKLL